MCVCPHNVLGCAQEEESEDEIAERCPVFVSYTANAFILHFEVAQYRTTNKLCVFGSIVNFMRARVYVYVYMYKCVCMYVCMLCVRVCVCVHAVLLCLVPARFIDVCVQNQVKKGICNL